MRAAWQEKSLRRLRCGDNYGPPANDLMNSRIPLFSVGCQVLIARNAPDASQHIKLSRHARPYIRPLSEVYKNTCEH